VNWSRNHRKAISFAFILLSNAAILSGCSARSRGFSFEDYKSAPPAQEKLAAMFPAGTDVDEFTKFMKELRATCYFSKERVTNAESVDCESILNTSIATGISWSIVADFDNKRKIIKLEVSRNLSAL
jgi:hypothetical protein